MESKAENEIRVFRHFVEVAGLSILQNTIEKRQPPEPDILCLHSNGEQVAYELVEVCNSDNARFPVSANRYHDCLMDAVERLDQADRIVFGERYNSRPLCFGFKSGVSENKVRSVADRIIRDLLEAPSFDDRLPTFQKTVAVVLEEVSCRGHLCAHGGLNFCFGGSFDAKIPLNAVVAKLSKSYRTNAPIELLAHVGGWVAPWASNFKGELAAVFQDQGLGPFRKAWVLEWEGVVLEYEKQ